MLKRWKYEVLIVLVCLGCNSLFAQEASVVPGSELNTPRMDSTRPFVIRDIIISGNKKTKAFIIERELLFKRGDSVNLADLVNRFERSRELLLNTTLFHTAIVSLKRFDGYKLDIAIDVRERWYLFPIPYFKPVDRNLSEWAKQGIGFDRVNYGLKLAYNNFTGRNDKLKAWLITGYSKQIQLQYELPYVDKALKTGFRVGVSYRTFKEVNYGTYNNEQQFHSDSSRVLSKQWGAFIDFTHRPAIKTRNTFHFAVVGQTVDTAITNRNPKYFSDGRTTMTFPELGYKVEYTDLDYNPYPQKGIAGEVSILKRGFGKDMNMWQLSAKGGKHFFVAPKLSFSMQAAGVIRLPFDQPFINTQLFGYGDFYLRGLEKYVIDGVGAGLFKTTLRRQVFYFGLPMPFGSSETIPFTFFLKTYGDVGYAHNKIANGNPLTNRMLYTGGFGLDILTFYDLSFKIEYSFNQMGQSGFFLHFKNDF